MQRGKKNEKNYEVDYPVTVGQLKKYKIYIMGLWGGKEKEKGTEEMFEVIMDINFSKFMINNKAQGQKFPRISNKINIKNDYI